MLYSHIRKGTFLRRPNRFIAEVIIDGKLTLCHVKNTGRCKELLVPETTVFVEEVFSEKRKTKFDLIAVEKQGVLINCLL